MFRFANPQYLHFLWLVPVIFILARYMNKKAKQKIATHLGEKLTPYLTASVSLSKRKLKLWLELGAIVFFIIALAQPQLGESQQEIKSQGVEMMIAVDVSNSMLAEDVKPNRLEFAKSELMKLIDQMPGNKVGLIAFAGSAALVSPITTDASALKMFIESLSVDTVSSQGTVIEKALLEAKDAFKRGGVDGDETNRVTRVILIASDGEDQEPNALKISEDLVKEGTHIFTMAFGTEKGAPIPDRDGTGYLRGYRKDKSGQIVTTRTTGEELKKLAQAGQGSFYHATFGGNHVKLLAEDINKLEKTDFSSSIATQYEERFQIFLTIGLILAFLELLLADRRRQFRLWRGRFEVPPA